MRKIFSQLWLKWDSNLHCLLWKCQVSNAIKETKLKVGHVFTLHHHAALGVYGEFIKFYQTFVS